VSWMTQTTCHLCHYRAGKGRAAHRGRQVLDFFGSRSATCTARARACAAGCGMRAVTRVTALTHLHPGCTSGRIRGTSNSSRGRRDSWACSLQRRGFRGSPRFRTKLVESTPAGCGASGWSPWVWRSDVSGTGPRDWRGEHCGRSLGQGSPVEWTVVGRVAPSCFGSVSSRVHDLQARCSGKGNPRQRL